jgi:predicted GNAT family N-acyltransferase
VPLAIEELDARRHDRADFDSGVEALNHYLKTLAAQHRAKGFASTFVLIDTDRPKHILGYYSLSAASLSFEEREPVKNRKGPPPAPIATVQIGRLAAAANLRGKRLGELLLQNAIKRILAARATLGVYAVVVESNEDTAEAFYRRYGFRLCDRARHQLYLPLGSP